MGKDLKSLRGLIYREISVAEKTQWQEKPRDGVIKKIVVRGIRGKQETARCSYEAHKKEHDQAWENHPGVIDIEKPRNDGYGETAH